MKKIWKNGFIYLLALTICAMYLPMGRVQAATGRVIHVAGANVGEGKTATGAEAHPYRSFKKATENLQPGDTVIVHKGIYQESWVWVTWHGTASNPITVKGCDEENCPICQENSELPGPVFTSKSNWKNSSEAARGDYFLKMNDCHYVNMSGFYITGYQGAGIWTYDGSHHLTISQMNIWDMDTPEESTSGVEGILVNYTNDSTFKDLNIWDIGQTRRSHCDHGLYIGHVENCTFENIKVQDVPGAGLHFYAGDNYDIHAKNCVIQNNVFSGCKYGLVLVGVDGFNIRNNTIYNSGHTDVYLDWTASNNRFYNNLFYNNRTEQYVDPLYGAAAPAIVGYQANSYNRSTNTITVTGNIFQSNLYDYCGSFSAICRDRNSYTYSVSNFANAQNNSSTGNRYRNFISGHARIRESIDTRNMPKGNAYESRIEKNAQKLMDDALEITANSDCIDKGNTSNAPVYDILGNARDSKADIGAYEYQTATIPDVPIEGVLLSQTSMVEKNAPGDVVGTLSVKNARNDRTYTFSLTGDENDNDQFVIEGDKLKAKNSFDYETKTQYTVEVAATDGRQVKKESFSISILPNENINHRHGTIHVFSGATESGDGSEAKPYRDFAKAVSNLVPGDTVLVHRGEYVLTKSIDITAIGRADKSIIIAGCTDENCAVCARNASAKAVNFGGTSGQTTADYFLKLNNSSYVTLKNLNISRYALIGVWTQNSSHITASDLRIWDIDCANAPQNGLAGFVVEQTKDSAFSHMTIYDIGQTRRSQCDHGIRVRDSENCTWDAITVQDVPGAGIEFYGGDNYNIHTQNCRVTNSIFSRGKYGVILTGVRGVKLINNTFYNNGNTDLYFDWTVQQSSFVNNLFYNDRTETFTDPDYGSSTPAVISFLANSRNSAGSNMTSGNMFYNSVYDYHGSYKAVGRYVGENGLITEASLLDMMDLQNKETDGNRYQNVNEGAANLSSSIDKTDLAKGDENKDRILKNQEALEKGALMLKGGSACIDAGLSSSDVPTADIAGEKRDVQADIGAYEYQKPAEIGNVTLSKSSLTENNRVGDTIGTFSVADAPAGAVYTYRLPAGRQNNSLFTIENNVLKAGAVFRYATKSSYTIEVEVTDGNISKTQTFTILIDKSANTGGGGTTGGGSTSGGGNGGGGGHSVFGGTSGSNTTEPDEPTQTDLFTDTANHWGKDAIYDMASRGFVSGYPDKTFAPDKTTTRAEFVSMVVRALGLSEKNGSSKFSDVKATDWYAGAINAAMENGIVSGVSQTKFAPQQPITRQEAMVIFSNVLARKNVEKKTDETVLSAFSDAGQIASWAKDSVVNLVGNRVVSGSNGKIYPQNPITRAEVCTLLQKILSF